MMSPEQQKRDLKKLIDSFTKSGNWRLVEELKEELRQIDEPENSLRDPGRDDVAIRSGEALQNNTANCSEVVQSKSCSSLENQQSNCD